MKIVKLDEVDTIDIPSSFQNVVVIPTETVYGLAARIDNETALNNIFKIKGRPSDNPLIVHISDLSMLNDLINGEIPAEYNILMDKFWPGPFTLLFKAKDSISKTITGNGVDTIAIRMPKNEKLRNVIRAIGVPLAAPSANTSGRPSPTTVQHVIDDLGEQVELYIDGGQCEVGLESTVFGIIDGNPIILRPGGITKEQIESTLCKDVTIKAKIENSGKVICPGQKYKHYSPTHPVYLFTGDNWHQNMKTYSLNFSSLKIGILQRKGLEYPIDFDAKYDLGESLKDCCKNIFFGLRYLDNRCDVIFVVGFEIEKEGLAIMDRLEKAASHIVK